MNSGNGQLPAKKKIRKVIRNIRGRPLPGWQNRFFKALKNIPHIERACALAGVSSNTAYRYQREDSKFAAAWREAESIGRARLKEGLEREAKRRAVNGDDDWEWREFAGRLVKCPKPRRKSDALLALMLKSHIPEVYRDQSQVQVVGDPQQPVAVEFTVAGVAAADLPQPKQAIDVQAQATPLPAPGHNGESGADGGTEI